MIRELLARDRVLLGLKGNFEDALAELLRCSARAEISSEWKSALAEGSHRYLFIDEAIAVPHVRLPGLTSPELILGISPRGLKIDDRRVQVVLLLATPAEEPDQHLKLLQRLTSLLPAIRDELVGARTVAAILRTFAREESLPGPTYINLTQEQVAFELRTDLGQGLSSAEALHRLSIHGPNALQRARRTPWTVRLVKNFFSFFAVLLWLAAVLCFVPGVDMPQLGAAILVVIVVNGLFSFLQEYKSDRAIEALERLLAPKCRVIRDGRTLEVDAATLVPGDVVELEEGDIVPADSRLFEAFEVEVDNSMLTGESTSARRYKSDRPVLVEGKFLWIELPNIVFAGTSLQKGSARAVVFGTGMHSEIGKIAGLTEAIRTEDSPLQRQLRTAVVTIALLASGLAALFLLLGWLWGGLSFVQAFVFFIGIFVANVPEGLLPTVTLSLAMGVTRMAKRNALVKSLPSVETLGSTTVICCDKTGTLTQNVMKVDRIYVEGSVVEVTGVGYEPRGNLLLERSALTLDAISQWPALRRLLECAYVCNNARVVRADRGVSSYRVIGDPTEGALIALAEKAQLRGTHQRLQLNPFESVRKRMSVVVRLEGHKEKTAYVKGAPLETLASCGSILNRGEVERLAEEDSVRIRAEVDSLASRGLRVLALAYRDDAELQETSCYDVSSVEKELVFLGLAAMTDPVRPEVPEAVRACHTAGIRVIMITGDHALTAESIGRQIGLGDGTGSSVKVLTGAEITELSDEDLGTLLAKGESIFARVTPEQKLRLVSLLSDSGEVVAVTGAGVNDAPALKKADIGIAMGARGNDVAKEAADIILTDDNFSSIVAAIEEGRGIYDNIKRFSAYVLNSNPQEMYPYVLWMLFPNVPLAMTVMGVLAVDVGTDLIPAMGLGIEPPEKDIMQRPPRRLDEKLLPLGFILRSYFVQGSLLAASSFATYFYWGWTAGFWRPGLPFASMPASPEGLNLALASTAYLQSLTAYFFPTVTTQIANVLSKRSSKTSLFSRDFLSPQHRSEILHYLSGSWRGAPPPRPVGSGLSAWRPRRHMARIEIDYPMRRLSPSDVAKAFGSLALALVTFPVRVVVMIGSGALVRLERPFITPLLALVARWLDRHPIVLNFVSNPLVDVGILFELGLCFLFFYSPLSTVYFFAPVPLHVYVFAFHGTLVLLLFEEIKKYYRRRGHALDALG